MSIPQLISPTSTPNALYPAQKTSSSISPSIGVVLAAFVTLTPSYSSLHQNSFMQNKTASKVGQNLDGSMIIFSNSASNDLIYRTSKHSNLITAYSEQLKELSNLPTNWDSYDAEPPNDTALNWTKEILNILSKIGFFPTRITPSVENGVAISFIGNGKYADIECFNDGDILAVTSDGTGNPEVWEVEANTLGIKSAIEKIRVFLNR